MNYDGTVFCYLVAVLNTCYRDCGGFLSVLMYLKFG